MAVVSISLPDRLLERVDEFIDERGYAGRSELFRTAARDLLNEEIEATGDERSATLTVVYPDEVQEEIGRVRHRFGDIVSSMMHGHTEHHCTEMFMLDGPGERIWEFLDALRGVRAIRLADVVFTDVVSRPVGSA
jgi:CopG family nickel-responsive transcriptional regulator